MSTSTPRLLGTRPNVKKLLRTCLGFTEREIRKANPKRTPWVPGLAVWYLLGGSRLHEDRPIGVVFDEGGMGDPSISF